MAFPNYAGKHAHDAIFHPRHFVEYIRGVRGLGDVRAPAGMILCYGSALWHQVRKDADRTSLPGIPDDMQIAMVADDVGVVGGFGIGGPAAAVIAELLIAWGTTGLVSIGWAGGLQRDAAIGDLVVCNGAIRDEGVSWHYLPPDTDAVPSAQLTAALVTALEAEGAAFRTGRTWTTDALYRETVEETRHYQEQGVLTVEMEAAALMAVAAHRGVEMATAFVVSDSLADFVWNPQFHAGETQAGLETLYRAAVAALEA